MLCESLYQLWPESGQAVAVTSREARASTLFWCLGILLHLWELEVKVRREGVEEVQDVGPAVVTHDAFGLHTGAKLHWAVVLVEHSVLLDSQQFAGFIQELQKPKKTPYNYCHFNSRFLLHSGLVGVCWSPSQFTWGKGRVTPTCKTHKQMLQTFKQASTLK